MIPDRMPVRTIFARRSIAVALASRRPGSAPAGQSSPRASEPAVQTADGPRREGAREADLKALEEALAASAEARRRLEAEIAEIKPTARSSTRL